nr:hypothetical protein [Burkholderia pseudomallei]
MDAPKPSASPFLDNRYSTDRESRFTLASCSRLAARGLRLAACCFGFGFSSSSSSSFCFSFSFSFSFSFCFCFCFCFAHELDRDRYRSRGQNTAPQPRPSRLPSRPVRPACPRDAKRKAPATGPGRPSSNPDGTAVRRRDANRAARALKTA